MNAFFMNDFDNGLLGELIAFRRDLHRNPELSMQEYKTSLKIMQRLETEGIPCCFIYEKLGVTALISGTHPGPTIALRADIDALPLSENTGLEFASSEANIMHACGHDIHTTVLLGIAIVLWHNRDKFAGDIRLIFQPSEESADGSKLVIQAGLLKGISCIVGFHCWPELPSGTVGFKTGPMMAASDTVKLVVIGKGGHAAHPNLCADPITATAAIITVMQTIISRETAPNDAAVLSITRICGGTCSNVIPSSVECEGTCRTLTPEVRKAMEGKIVRVAKNTAAAMNVQCKVTYTKGCPPLINNNELIGYAETAVRNVLGDDAVKQLEYPSMGSEDFSFYLESVPGIFLRLGTSNYMQNSKFGLHNPSVVFDEGAIPTGVKALTSVAVQILEQLS